MNQILMRAVLFLHFIERPLHAKTGMGKAERRRFLFFILEVH